MPLVMNAPQLTQFMLEQFPQMADEFTILDVSSEELTVAMDATDKHLRPGGTVSGPSLFGLADCAYYLATLARIGPKALTVTTNCSIDFMRKPKPGRVVAKARVLKLGRSLSVGDVLMYSEGDDRPVARASLTYSIPPDRGQG